MTGQEIERRAAPSIEETWRVAKGFAMSGYFEDAKTAERAFVKVMAGAEMGLAPFQSMTGIHIVKGKPVIGAVMLGTLLDRSPEYDYETSWWPDQLNATACTITISKNGKERGSATFSVADAERAGLIRADSGWAKYPLDMLRARAMSRAVRWHAPGLLGQATYVEGEEPEEVLPPHIQELDADEGRSGGVIDVPPNVTGYANPDDPMDDLPFLPEDAAPASPEAESPPLPTGPAAAGEEPLVTPGANDEGLFIATQADADRFVNRLNGEQLGILRKVLQLDGRSSRRIVSETLLAQRQDWDEQDVLRDMSGWGS